MHPPSTSEIHACLLPAEAKEMCLVVFLYVLGVVLESCPTLPRKILMYSWMGLFLGGSI